MPEQTSAGGRCALTGTRAWNVSTHRYGYLRPLSMSELLELAAERPGARLVAGGTDLLLHIRHRTAQPSELISLRRVPELRYLERSTQGLRIGAAVTLGELLALPGLARDYPALAEAARTLGSVQVRNQASVGGNLCNASPCANLAPPLLVAAARVRLRSRYGPRELTLEDFFVGPGRTALEAGELLECVLVDPPAEGRHSLFLRQGRVAMDLAIASLAIQLELDGALCRVARLAAGSVAPVPLRLERCEQLLVGHELAAERIEQAARVAAEDVRPISDVRGSASYRRRLIEVFVRRGLTRLAAAATGAGQ